MKLHPRAQLVQRHRSEFGELLINFMDGRDITYTELLIVVNGCVQEAVLKYMLREERHPGQPEKRADEE